jgi:glycosyltransferase involved in cell wall biosynthesis
MESHDNPKIIFLAWAPFSPRTQNLAESLGAKINLLNYKFRKKLYSPLKYPVLFVRTLKILRKENPDIIINQIPPIFCAISVLAYKKFLLGKKKKCSMIIDAHTGAFNRPWTFLKPLNKLAMTKADLVIVTNNDLKAKVLKDYNVDSKVLEDRVPDFSFTPVHAYKEKDNSPHSFSVAFICSFAYDEPLENIIQAAVALPETRFFITGDYSKMDSNKKRALDNKPGNVIFTGFVSYDDYVSLLRYVDAVIVLTNRDKTMLSGAFEALAVGKPLITSNWNCLMQYYSKGAICTDNSTAQIKEAIQTVQRKKEQLEKEMIQLKDERVKEWDERFYHLKESILNK